MQDRIGMVEPMNFTPASVNGFKRGAKMVSGVIVLLGAVLWSLIGCGCASYYVASGSRNAINSRRAIQATQMNDQTVIWVDLLALETLRERPWMQLGAALTDAAALYGAYRGVKELQDQLEDDDGEDEPKEPAEPPVPAVSIQVNGDYNQVYYQGPAPQQGSTP
jgi:hypothetical protein